MPLRIERRLRYQTIPLNTEEFDQEQDAKLQIPPQPPPPSDGDPMLYVRHADARAGVHLVNGFLQQIEPVAPMRRRSSGRHKRTRRGRIGRALGGGQKISRRD
ncbi:50S ribosomal protein L2 [Striga asiatica]|uniref:50S ribosomal protein L2 n=1 Tax=Striga asiatica TaxID=4170 RepID=A0A5A7R2I4_STRAF|nr:50S ribosomal protein L2 [Striga asiatica]